MTVKADTRLRRIPERGSKDLQLAHQIIDDSRICHVGYTLDEQPYVVPMALGRDGDRILLHGSVVSRLMTNLAGGLPCCVTITHLDGMVLARSGFHCSMNYRSVVIHGSGHKVEDARKGEILDAFVERLVPGLTADLRPSTAKEIRATTILEFPLEEVAAKVRTGPPVDDEEDYALPIWAGVVPIAMKAGRPVDDPRLADGIAPPAYVRRYSRRLAGTGR